jgi:hypothetical protein
VSAPTARRGPTPSASTVTSARPCASRPTAPRRRTTRSSVGRTQSPRSGPSGIATFRRRRSTGTGSSGSSSTGRAAGKNYGWAIVAYGIEYSGEPIPGTQTNRQGYEQPTYYWDPVIAPSGAQFYTGDAFPEWKGSMFIGAMKEMRLVRLKIENNRVTGEEHLLTDRRQRIRDVRQGPDGALYLVTDQANGELWKIAPRR